MIANVDQADNVISRDCRRLRPFISHSCVWVRVLPLPQSATLHCCGYEPARVRVHGPPDLLATLPAVCLIEPADAGASTTCAVVTVDRVVVVIVVVVVALLSSSSGDGYAAWREEEEEEEEKAGRRHCRANRMLNTYEPEEATAKDVEEKTSLPSPSTDKGNDVTSRSNELVSGSLAWVGLDWGGGSGGGGGGGGVAGAGSEGREGEGPSGSVVGGWEVRGGGRVRGVCY